jgi:hypothetical protein
VRRHQHLQFGARDVWLLGHRAPQQRPLGVLQQRLGTPAGPRREILPGPMPPEHLFDEREADTKYSRDVPNRLVSLLNGGHHSTA